MRIFDIIKTELHAEKLKHEEELERVMNNKNLETENKVESIKKLLREITTIEMSITKFKDYTSEDETNDK